MRALFEAVVVLAMDDAKPVTDKGMETTFRHMREMTRNSEQENSCRRLGLHPRATGNAGGDADKQADRALVLRYDIFHSVHHRVPGSQ
jgi:hypothetical protein